MQKNLAAKPTTVEPILYDSYLAAIKNSEGSNIFRNFYARVNGHKKDVLRDGDLSCAFYVSSLLVMFGFIKKIHATVKNTIKDLEESGWTKITKPEIGSILVWEKKLFENNEAHDHIGFYLGQDTAISNSEKFKVPKTHHITWDKDSKGDPKRKVVAIYWRDLG